MANRIDDGTGGTTGTVPTFDWRTLMQQAGPPAPPPQPVYQDPRNNPAYFRNPEPPRNTTQAFRQADQAAGAVAKPTLPQWMQAQANTFQSGVKNAASSISQAGRNLPGWLIGSAASAATSLQNQAPYWPGRAAYYFSHPNQNPEGMNPAHRGGGGPGGQAFLPKPPKDTRIFGVDYGPNWTRDNTNPADWIDPATGKKLGQTWRQDMSKIMMTPDEALRRRQSYLEQFQPGYTDWQRRSFEAASTLSPSQYNAWIQKNPPPTGFLQTQQEYINRQNAAPTGYIYTPFGSSYIKRPSLPSMNTGSGGGGGGYGGYGYGYGGGGGGGGGYQSPAASFYNQLANWRVLQVQGG